MISNKAAKQNYSPTVARLAPRLYTLLGDIPWYAKGRYFTNAAAALIVVEEIKTNKKGV